MQTPNELSLAVLPFRSGEKDSKTQLFADGITEELIHYLAQISSLKVSSRTSSFYYQHKALPANHIAGKLKVRLLIEGSIYWRNGGIKMQLHMVDAVQDQLLWSSSWQVENEEFLAIQEDIFQEVAEKVREQLGHFEVPLGPQKSKPLTWDAYTLYLKGKSSFRLWNPEAASKAITYYNQALEVDPNHVASMLGKADALSFLGTTGQMDYSESWELTEGLVREALLIQADALGAHYLLANHAFFLTGNFSRAYAYTQASLEKHPNHPESLHFLIFLLLVSGRAQEAEKPLEKVKSIDPFSSETLFFEAYLYYMQGQFKLALHLLNELLAIFPENVPAVSIKAYALLKLQRFQEAISCFDKLPEPLVVDQDREGIALLAAIGKKEIHGSSNKIKEWEALADRPEGFRAHSFLPFIYAALGEETKLLKWIRDQKEQPRFLSMMQINDPLVAPFQDHPEILSLVNTWFKRPNSKPPANPAPLLDENQTESYSKALTRALEEEQIWLDPNLSLKNLAAKLELHPNKLSWLINSNFGQNYNRLINGYRVREFQKQVLDSNTSKFSFLGLAYASGFNSKTSFHNAFKQLTGLSPGDWMKLNT